MKKVKVKSNHADMDFNDVAAVADRMASDRKTPELELDFCDELTVRNIDEVGHNFASRKAGQGHVRAEKTHITDLPSELQHLLADAFERRVTASKEKLKAESAEIRVDRDRLVKVNEQQGAQIEALMLALGDAEVKIADQARRIARLKNEIAEGRAALAKSEKRIRDARQELTRVKNTLEDHPSDMSGGA